MRTIKKLSFADIDAYTEIAYNAYPSFKDYSEEGVISYKKNLAHIMESDEIVSVYGMYEDESLIAVMRLFDFTANLFGELVPVSGIGFLGVHLLHKRKGIAQEMLDFYEEHYRERGIFLGLLLPFRPDFYKKMGYTLGSKLNQYRLPPDRFPKTNSPISLRYLSSPDTISLLRCHNEFVLKHHGLMQKFGDEIRPLFQDKAEKIIGVFDEEGKLSGYIRFIFENGKDHNYTINHMIVLELVYLCSKSLATILNFIHAQKDQVQLVVLNTFDQSFYHLIDDPRNDSLNYIPYGYLESNTQAVGAMYKILDVKGLLEQCSHRTYNDQKLSFTLTIGCDSKSSEAYNISIDGQQVRFDNASPDFEICMSIATFTAIYLGISKARELFNLGLLEISNENYLESFSKAFEYCQNPICYTDF